MIWQYATVPTGGVDEETTQRHGNNSRALDDFNYQRYYQPSRDSGMNRQTIPFGRSAPRQTSWKDAINERGFGHRTIAGRGKERG